MSVQLKRVLILDPHEDVLIRLQKSLEDAGFDTETAWTGADATRLLSQEVFDVVLMNEYLPDCDCDVMLRRIREKFSNVGYVLMSSFAPRMNQNGKVKKLGKCAVVCKHDLAAVVAAVMQEAKPSVRVCPQDRLRAAG